MTATIALLWVTGGAVLITRNVTRTHRPDAWRWYAVSLAAGVVGAGLVTLTRAQLRVLRNMGHRYMQGCLFARPLELEQLGAQLRALDGLRAGWIDDSIVAMVGSPVRTLS